jgi:UDP-N-acetylglucosamine--dolichyl-phosphate N-acetylglucosaminephosphotransferase
MDDVVITLIVQFCFSFFIALIIIPIIIKFAHRRGILGKDMYKYKETKVAEMGGMAIIVSYSIGLLVALYFINDSQKFELMGVLSSVLFIGLVGVFDDLFGLRHREKIFLPLFAAIPLIFTRLGFTSISLPLIGQIELGWFYTLIIIPLFIMVVSNLTNMLAGLNGLESGLGIITLLTLAISAAILGKWNVLFVVVPLIGALIVFFYFNWFPAKIFPGDSGTLLIGCVIAISGIIGNMDFIVIFLMTLYTINFLMYIFNARTLLKNKWKFGKVDKNGYIHPPHKKGRFGSLYFLLPYLFRLKEKQLVLSIFLIQLIFCLVVLVFAVLL